MKKENKGEIIKEKNGKVIVLDVDGVLLEFTPAFDKAAEVFLKRKITVPKKNKGLTPYDLCQRINGTIQEVEDTLQFMLDTGVYANLKPLEGAKEAVDMIKAAGFKIVICTALPESAKEMRLENLKNVLGLVPDAIYCVGMGMSKKEALEEIRPDVYADDRIKYLKEANFVHYLVWCDQFEEQDYLDDPVTTHVHSLNEWVQKHMKKAVEDLDNYYDNKHPLQIGMKFETARRRYGS
jgi:hypothetical protein